MNPFFVHATIDSEEPSGFPETYKPGGKTMYPVCVCSIEQNKEGVCFLRKTGETERQEVPRALARFLARLDGKTDPLALVPGFPKEEMDKHLSALEEMDYITTRRRNGSLLSAQLTLWFAPRHVPAAVRRTCRALSLLLAVICFPVLIIGLRQLLHGNLPQVSRIWW